jgi:hypothetical protein
MCARARRSTNVLPTPRGPAGDEEALGVSAGIKSVRLVPLLRRTEQEDAVVLRAGHRVVEHADQLAARFAGGRA